MHASEFTPEAPGRLVGIPEGPPGCVAFVPTPIPRRLAIGNRTIGLLSHAENALGRLEGCVGRMVNPYLIARPLLRREAILSSRMEGTHTTAAKLVSFEAHRTGTSDRDTREVANYIAAMNHGVSLLEQLPLCLRLIRELHEKLLEGVRGAEETPGQFRLIQNFIGHSDIASARFIPPPASEIEPLLRDLEQFMNEEDPEAPPLLVRLALAHYQFETIHPFRDGNGRVGRLLLPLSLLARQRLNSPTLYLSSFFEQHKGRYVDLMLAVSQQGGFESWVQFFLEAVQISAQQSIDQANRLLELHARYYDLLQRVRSSALTLKLIDKLFELPLATVASVARDLDVTPATATQHIQRLVEHKILIEATGRKRDREYLAPELLDLLGTNEE